MLVCKLPTEIITFKERLNIVLSIMKSCTKNALEGEKQATIKLDIIGGKKRPRKMSKETNNEELFTPPKKPSKK
jgi:hypothetical protein